MVTCDDQGIKYLLSVAMVEGTDLDDASAGIPQNDVNWVVSLDFNGDGTDTFAEISRALYGTQKQFAIVLDGVVISAPTMDGIILNGQAQISGNFNQASAESLAPACATAPCRSRSRRTPRSRPSVLHSPVTSSRPASSRA
jgi:preprotein translocase subunit SecD